MLKSFCRGDYRSSRKKAKCAGDYRSPAAENRKVACNKTKYTGDYRSPAKDLNIGEMKKRPQKQFVRGNRNSPERVLFNDFVAARNGAFQPKNLICGGRAGDISPATGKLPVAALKPIVS